MFHALHNSLRLARAAFVLATRGVRFVPQGLALPGPLALLAAPAPQTASRVKREGERLSKAVQALGPSYIKLGQFLSTRPDITGPRLADALSGLRDRLPSFPLAEAKAEIEAAFGRPWNAVFAQPVAAASIAQVHKATVSEDGGGARAVAVKVLRPGIERRFRRDLESFYFAAGFAERFAPKTRRLRPTAAVDTLAQSTVLELDLRLEAAAISEMAENIKKAGDTGFRVPTVDWDRTAKRVLTLEWIDAIPLTDHAAIAASTLDRHALGLTVIQSFLKHAIRDGFFHADMHAGNLFADPRDNTLIAVDFGIMGRIGPNEQRFLAEILYGFITKNYRRIAEVHFEAGYVPPGQDVLAFAQALRSIGEPIMGRSAGDISMARLLTQLFEVTELFSMRMRPELLLLQKTMVVVEGVARSLDPSLNIWTAAEPIVREWVAGQLNPVARLREAVLDAGALVQALKQAPTFLQRSARMMEALEMQDARIPRPVWKGLALPLWFAAAALAVIAAKTLLS